MNKIRDNVYYMTDSKKFGGLKINRDDKAYNNTKDGDYQMNENNPMDTLFKEVKIDMREREERSRKEINEREERYEKQLDRYAAEAVAREERFREDFKEREERIATSLDKLEGNMALYSEGMETMKNQNFWGNIALFVGMLAIVITLLLVT